METLDEPPSQLLAVLLSPSVITYVGTLLVLLLFSALISGSEVAFFSFRNKDIAAFQKGNNPNERKILQLLQNPRRLLATILILNNFINIAIVTISTFLTWEIVGSRTTEGLVIVILTAAVTFVIVFFGEVMPKVYANQNNIGFAKITASVLLLFRTLVQPVSWLLLNASGIIERRFEKKGYAASVDELNKALEIATDGNTTEEEKEILKGIVNFGTLNVKQIMRSRLDLTAFDSDIGFHELLDKVNKSGFSRVPVYSETIDNIDGILYIKDLLPYVEEGENFHWQKLLRPGMFVPETKKIDSLLKDFQEKRVHMAIVVDEYGGTSGLLTLEDIIEEIVGEINDEFDEEAVAYNKLDDNTFVFEGKTSLNDFCKTISEDVGVFEEVKGESESLGGLILEINSTFPRAGEKIAFNRFVFTVVAIDKKRIKRVRVHIKAKSKDSSFERHSD